MGADASGHVKAFGVAPDGRIFRNAAGGYIDPAAYGKTWARARDGALELHEHAVLLGKHPYDLRSAGISFWLASGVDPAECARRAGQGIQVMFRYYAKFISGAQEHANRLIEDSMVHWDVGPSTEPRGPGSSRPGNAPEQLGKGGTPVGDIGRTRSARPPRR